MASSATPVTFRNGIKSKNAFCLAALTNGQSHKDGTISDDEFNWIVRRAKGGCGIITSCASHVSEDGQGWPGELGCWSDIHIPGLKRMTDAVHEHGALMIQQIFHGGMRANDTLFDMGAITAVKSTYQDRSGRVTECREATVEEIERVIADFVAAAKRCVEAGMDGVELHGAHGYLLTQFLCPEHNTRTDEWGGPQLENRARLIRRCLQGIRAAVPDTFLVGIRLSPEPGFEKAGWMMDPDENIQVAKWCAEDGADFISVSLFGDSSTYVAGKRRDVPGAKPVAQEFREALPEDVKLMVCGGVNSGQVVERLLGLGVDIAVLGKAPIGDPDFPNEVVKNPSYTAVAHPWTPEYLSTVDVSPTFVGYLKAMGLVKA